MHRESVHMVGTNGNISWVHRVHVDIEATENRSLHYLALHKHKLNSLKPMQIN